MLLSGFGVAGMGEPFLFQQTPGMPSEHAVISQVTKDDGGESFLWGI